MRTIRFRLDGKANRVIAVMRLLRDMDDVDRVEEVADQSDHHHEDSSSAGLSEASSGDFHDIVVHAMNAAAAQRVHDRIVLATRELDVAAEFVDRF